MYKGCRPGSGLRHWEFQLNKGYRADSEQLCRSGAKTAETVAGASSKYLEVIKVYDEKYLT